MLGRKRDRHHLPTTAETPKDDRVAAPGVALTGEISTSAPMLDLATLVAPLETDTFLSDRWPDSPWWSEEGAERVTALVAIPELRSAEVALERSDEVKVIEGDGSIVSVPNGAAAMPYYERGLTCYSLGRHIPALLEITTQLTATLGMPAGSLMTELFCSTGNSGVRMHSDFDTNFAVLVRGRKTWRIAPNRHIRNQTDQCVSTGQDPLDPGQFALADVTPFPSEMPSDATELHMGPGGTLFIPRGWWHETRSFGECLQVNFVVKGPMWLRVAGAAIQRRLRADPEWRAFAYDAFASGARGDAALDRLAALVPGLREVLGGLFDGEDREVARRLLDGSGYRPQPPA